MPKLRVLLVLFAIALSFSSACVVEEPGYRRQACAGGIWIRGHRGPRGRWHEGHWRCPNVVEVVEVE